ncbi:unnamed protein product [Schistosoma margrebowiei]|uniref:Uncharacterized protein n=1 Tax=Schistosoma margrebowiei TaxID=48269 RepID=A0A183LY56_9TREM|nr:unnamed protein product [Schistosoma margrebowiei]
MNMRYTCRHDRYDGEVNKLGDDLNWIVNLKNRFKTPTNITVQEHAKHIRFDCQINEKVNILSYKWLKNKVDINLQPDIQHRYQILQNGSLYLTQINRNDTGIYTCQVAFKYSNSQHNYMKPLATEQNDNKQRQIDFISEYLRNREHGYNEELEKVKQNLEASAWLNVQCMLVW